MADITIVSVAVEKDKEAVYEKEVVLPARKMRFTIKQLDAQIASLQARIAQLEKDKTDALAITEQPK